MQERGQVNELTATNVAGHTMPYTSCGFHFSIRHQASFRDAVWPDGSNDTVAMDIWGLGTHPDWQVQQLLADIVVYYIQKSYARFIDVSVALMCRTPWRAL